MNKSIKVFIGASILAVALVGSAQAQRESEAAREYYKAAVQGSADAQASLGALYATGTGVQQSDAVAFQWLKRAAEQGHCKAQLMLGEIWANGTGVPRNDLFAYKWAYLAKANGADSDTWERAATLLDRLAQHMSGAQIADARQRAAEWKPDLEATPTIQAEPVSAPAAPRHAAKKVHTERRTEAVRSAPQAGSLRHVRPRIIRYARKWSW